MSPIPFLTSASLWHGCMLWTVLLGAALSPPSALAGEPRIESTVYEELARAPDGRAFVIVALEPVPLRPRGEEAQRRAEIAARQARVLAQLTADRFEAVYTYSNVAAIAGRVDPAGLDVLARHPEVRSVGPDLSGRAACDVSVPFIGANAVQHTGFTGRGVTVAVIDSGITSNHADLSDNIADGAYHFINQGMAGPGAPDATGHGTNVAGIITSKGTVSPVGVAPDTDVLPIQVINAGGTWWMSDLIAAIDYVVDHASDYDYLCALNLSLGTYALYTHCPCDDVAELVALADALDAAKASGMAIFAASGNDGYCDRMCAPACLSAAVAVASVYDQDYDREPNSGTYSNEFSGFPACYDADALPDQITCFSNRSTCNRLAAPGRLITSCGWGGTTSTFTGTSQATPHCTALAALIAESGARRFFFYLPDDLVEIMEDTGVATSDPCSTTPNPTRIDAYAALDEVVGLPCPLEKIVAADSQMNHCFGESLAADGHTIVAGRSSKVYVYRQSGLSWPEEAQLVANDPDSFNFGCSVAISGDLIVVGDHWNNVPPNAAVGAVFVFRRVGSVWVKEAKLRAADWAQNDWFGHAVAVEGNRIVVGSYLNDDACPANPNCDSGSVYIFEYSAGAWIQTAKLLAPDAAQGDHFGASVALRGDRVVIGADQDDDLGADAGAAYVFRIQDGSWVFEQKLTSPLGAAGDHFGFAVALDTDFAAVGAYLDDHIGPDAGSVTVFSRAGLSWFVNDYLWAADREAGDRFGRAVALRDDVLVVGAPENDDGTVAAGSAYTFAHGDSTWWQRHKLLAPDPSSWATLGWSVAVDAGAALVGARGDNSNRGAVYLYGVAGDCNANGRPDLCDIFNGLSADSNENGSPDECEQHVGDLNCDGVVGFADINPFVLAVIGYEVYHAQYPACNWYNADCNGDGQVNFADINPFVALLSGGGF